VAEGSTTVRNHHRKRSGPTPPSTSPKIASVKRNSSAVSLARNGSHVSLKKNHSATSLHRNGSHPHVKKLGLPPIQHHTDKPKKDLSKRVVGFEIGSPDEEEQEEEQWEDSSHSPETTRQNSAANTRPPSHEDLGQKNLDQQRSSSSSDHDSPPQSLLPTPATTKPARPPITKHHTSPIRPPDHEAVTSRLLHYPRSSHAPPAMSSISATATPNSERRNLHRTDSSFSHVSHTDAASMPGSTLVNNTPNNGHGTSSSADGGVSRFIEGGTSYDANEDSEPEKASSILPNYHRQSAPSSPGSAQRPKTPPPQRRVEPASRTLQKLSLQRLAAMTGSPGDEGMAASAPEPVALQRTGSRGRVRGAATDSKLTRKEHDLAIFQLSVVRRFWNPVVESLQRLEKSDTSSKRSAVGQPNDKVSNAGKAKSKTRLSQSLEDREGQDSGRAKYQQPGSHDDLRLSRKGDDGEGADEEWGGEEDLIRRMWESREMVGGD